MNSDWTIIYYYNSRTHSPIHATDNKESNKNTNFIIADVFDELFVQEYETNFSKNYIEGRTNLENELTGFEKYSWRNCDKFIRHWLKKNKHLITTERVALIEWDVLFTKELPTHLNLKNKILTRTRHLYSKDRDDWNWFREISQLDDFQKSACGITIMGCLLFDKTFLDIWLNQEFDPLYKKDIFCELRLGTIMNHSNIEWDTYSSFMPEVRFNCCFKPEILGYYHPVKVSQESYWNGFESLKYK